MQRLKVRKYLWFATPLLIGFLFLIFNCKLRWTDLKFEHVNASEVASLSVMRKSAGWKTNLVGKDLVIESKRVISQVITILNENVPDRFGHTRRIWDCRLIFNFVSGNYLSMTVIKSANQGTLIEFCDQCFGIKSVARNDKLGDFMEKMVGFTEPVE